MLTGHILDSDTSALHDQNIINTSVHDNCTFVLFNNVGEDAEHRRNRVISAVNIDILVGAFAPLNVWGMDRILNICAVEVNGRLGQAQSFNAATQVIVLYNKAHLLVVEAARETQYIPKNGPDVQDTVLVEVGVEAQGLTVDRIPESAFLSNVGVVGNTLVGAGWERKRALGRVSRVRLIVIGKSAFVRTFLETCNE